MVTRNVTEVEVYAMSVDLTSNEVVESVFIGNPMYAADDEKQLNYIKKHNDSGELLIVKINKQIA